MQIDKHASEPTIHQVAKLQLGGPLAILWSPVFRQNLDALGYCPWDTITGPEMAKAAGISPRKMPDWRRSVTTVFLAEPEHNQLFRGRADHYRMDVLYDWIDSRGCRPTDRSTLWQRAAAFLERHHLGRPSSGIEVDDRLNWLWENGLFLPRFTPSKRPYYPYSDRAN